MNTEQMPVVTLSGSPHERGLQHGEALRGPIAEHIARTKEWLGREGGGDPDAFITEFLETVNFTAAIDRWTPGLNDEILGIATGAGQPLADVMALQFIDEVWWHAYYRQRRADASLPEQCSSLGVITDEGTFIGQTMDVPVYAEGLQTLLQIEGNGDHPDAFVITLAGTVACYGLNSAGVGICCNTLMQLNHNRRGLPVALVVRGALRQRSFAAAARFIEDVPHASGQNYLVGGPGEIASFECGSGEVAQYWPLANRQRVYHTNHPLVNRASQQYQAANRLSEADVIGSSANSQARLAVLDRQLGDLSRPVGFDDLRNVLSSREDQDYPICRLMSDPGGGFSAATLLYELSATPPVLHLAAGPLLTSELRRFAFAPSSVAADTVLATTD